MGTAGVGTLPGTLRALQYVTGGWQLTVKRGEIKLTAGACAHVCHAHEAIDAVTGCQFLQHIKAQVVLLARGNRADACHQGELHRQLSIMSSTNLIVG